jgi:hypothetical protein
MGYTDKKTNTALEDLTKSVEPLFLPAPAGTSPNI